MLNSVGASTQPCSTPFVKRFRVLTIVLDKHAIMELLHHCYKSVWTTKLCHDFPKPITTDCDKRFGKVDKGHVTGPHFVLGISLGGV